MKPEGISKSSPGRLRMSSAAAESLAIEALVFLAGDPERLERFMSLSGLSVDNLRAAATDPGFLAAVLDHLAGDEALLLSFAGNGGHDPAGIALARACLDRAPPP